MSTISKKVHFIKSLDHKPICGRGRIIAMCALQKRYVTCRRCMRLLEHIAKKQGEGISK